MYEKINHYTWVKKGGSGIVKNRFYKIKRQSTKSKVLDKPVKYQNKTLFYKSLCIQIFSRRKFVLENEFNQWIKIYINNNVTWYRERMKALGFIKSEYHVIKPGDALYQRKSNIVITPFLDSKKRK